MKTLNMLALHIKVLFLFQANKSLSLSLLENQIFTKLQNKCEQIYEQFNLKIHQKSIGYVEESCI